MTSCTCRENIEALRASMELTYMKYESFTHANVLAASQQLDDALVSFRKCPCYNYCISPNYLVADDHSIIVVTKSVAV
ncbi:Spo0E family sporulation regulatory protein-aspartic acid phosphatase [Paenibacillus yanchengensis]|uniref:Spo0E family sporulation regulatory protein-aspartic acid phosphatase n=1 Tax=Paenibacillus yanchengensis TaxID=2035833 RepID=A0ABW4YFQ1_9BACL